MSLGMAGPERYGKDRGYGKRRKTKNMKETWKDLKRCGKIIMKQDRRNTQTTLSTRGTSKILKNSTGCRYRRAYANR
jgi:hypothetical protein